MSTSMKLPFSATGMDYNYLKGQFDLLLLLKCTNTAKHVVRQNSEKSKHIPECNSSAFAVWIIKIVHLVTQCNIKRQRNSLPGERIVLP